MKILPISNYKVGSNTSVKQNNNLLYKNETDSFSRTTNGCLKEKEFKIDNFISFYGIIKRNRNDEYSYEEFIKAADKSCLNTIENITANIKPENLIGTGANSKVYKFDNEKLDKWVLKEDNKPFDKPVDELFKAVKDDFQGYNVGQEIAISGDRYRILKKITGTPHSISDWSGKINSGIKVNREESLKFLNSLNIIQQFPQSSFDNYAYDLKMLEDKDYKQDSINPNNILIDYDKQKIQIIDFFKAVNPAHINSKQDLINALLDFSLFSCFYENLNEKEQTQLVESANTIINKCTIASKKAGLKQDEKTYLDFLANVDKYFGRFLVDKGGNYKTRYNLMKNILAGNNSRSFDAKSFLQKLSQENAQKKYYFSKETAGKIEYYDKILPNAEAIQSLEQLDKLNIAQKKQFIEEFCSMTGFPDFEAVTQNIEKEFNSSIHHLAEEENFDVKFTGYDSNCSVGRKLAIPGSDCDGLFMIIDTKAHKEPWYAGKIRWDFKDRVNQRILSTPANHLPEVLSTGFIEQGLEIAQSAFEKCNFSNADLNRFEELLNDDTNDFVKSAEFNIRMAQKVPEGIQNRDLYYKTAMLAEIIRDGVVSENNLDKELYNKIINSPLYKYSNLMKQKGLKHSLKSKYIARQSLKEDFYKLNTDNQFQMIKDLIYFSLGKVQNNENKKYFYNQNTGSNNEMGNIEKMYELVMNIPYNGN